MVVDEEAEGTLHVLLFVSEGVLDGVLDLIHPAESTLCILARDFSELRKMNGLDERNMSNETDEYIFVMED